MKNHIRNRLYSNGIFLSVWEGGSNGAASFLQARTQPMPAVPCEPGLPAPSPEGSPVLCGLLQREAQTPLALSARQAEVEEQEREGESWGAVSHEMEVPRLDLGCSRASAAS